MATTSGESDAVEIIDVFANRTRTMASASGSRSGFGFGSGAAADGPGAGLLDVSFCPGAGDAFVASSRRGRCYLWDARCAGGKPRAELVAPTDAKSPVHCVRVSPNGQTVFAGTGSGLVHVWDLRGGTRARAAAFSVATQNKVSRELLRSLDLTDLLGRVPTLRDGPGKVAKSAVHWMEQDPGDPGRLGFHLACGWSGVADLLAGSGGARPRTPPVPSSPTRTVPRRRGRRPRTARDVSSRGSPRRRCRTDGPRRGSSREGDERGRRWRWDARGD